MHEQQTIRPLPSRAIHDEGFVVETRSAPTLLDNEVEVRCRKQDASLLFEITAFVGISRRAKAMSLRLQPHAARQLYELLRNQFEQHAS